MDPLVLVAVIAAVLVTALVVTSPLRGGAARAQDADASRVADLLAAKEAKYREIRDAEMDHRTGKLSEADWKALDRELRAEAVAILRELDRYDAGRS